MKTRSTIILAVIAALAITACQSPTDKIKTCDTARVLYEAYQASLQTGRPVSKDEIMVATSAAAFLRLYCGWTNEPARSFATSDSNGVPILVPGRRNEQ